MFNDLEILESAFPILLNRWNKYFSKYFEESLRPLGLSKLHALYLIVLYSNNDSGIKLNDFNEILSCDKANTSRAINDLIDKEIIYKVTGNCEKKFLVMLTSKGMDLAKAFCDDVRLKNMELLNVFEQKEKLEFLRLVDKLVEGVKNDTN